MTPEYSLTWRYKRYVTIRICVLAFSFLALMIFALWVCCIGFADISPRRILSTWFDFARVFWNETPLGDRERNILLFLRIPRVTMAIIAGAGLGAAGTVMQAVTKNAMASPFTTGLSSAAAFGAATAALFLNVSPAAQKTAVMASAFGMGGLCAVVLYSISMLRGMGAANLVLAGIALNYLFSALNASIQFIANEHQLPAIINWTFGNLTAATWQDTAICGIILAFAEFTFFTKARPLNLISIESDDGARALGVDAKRLRAVTGLGATLLTASIVSVTGTIGFIGLAAPHIARMLIGGNHIFLLPLSSIVGAFLVLASDAVGRTMFAPSIIPVGIVVSYLGVPMFAYLILRERKKDIL
jgi:iron complex transport system permease protein